METDRLDRAAWLDTARILAALAVWAFHFGRFDYGYLGVPVFFMISGFVVAQSAASRNAMQFAVARAARLFPAFVLCLAMTALIIPTPPDWPTLLANLTMAPRALGYPEIDGVYWSLMFEIMFYGWCALLMVGGNFDSRLRILVGVWLALSVVHLLHPLPLKVVLILDWGPYFCAGCSVYLMRRRLAGARSLWLASSLAAGAAAAAQTRFDPLVAGGIVLTAAVLFPLLSRARAPTLLSSLGGALSYPLYLLHNEFGGGIARLTGSEILSLLAVVAAAYAVTRIEPYGKRLVLHSLPASQPARELSAIRRIGKGHDPAATALDAR